MRILLKNRSGIKSILLGIISLLALSVHCQIDHKQLRENMIKEQLLARDISDPATLKAMRNVPRHEFVPADMQPYAYSDNPLPIGMKQTISQPYIVAYMTQVLKLKEHDPVS